MSGCGELPGGSEQTLVRCASNGYFFCGPCDRGQEGGEGYHISYLGRFNMGSPLTSSSKSTPFLSWMKSKRVPPVVIDRQPEQHKIRF